MRTINLFEVWGSIAIQDGPAMQALNNVEKQAKGLSDKLGKMGKKMGDVGKKMTLAVSAPIAGMVGIMANSAMELEATEAKYAIVFGDFREEADDFIKQFQKLTPATTAEARNMASGIQDLLVPLGFMREEATQMTSEFMHVTGALANFNNGTHSAEQVSRAMQGAITGQYESLKALGIQLDVGVVKQKAVEMGLASTTDEVTKQDMAQVALSEIYRQSTDALDAYTEESLDAKTKMGLLRASIGDLGASFGEHLLPIIENAVKKIGELADWFGQLDESQQKTILKVMGLVAVIGPLLVIFGKILTILPLIKTAFLALTSPIGLIVVAIVGLIAVFVALYKNNEEFRNKVNEVWEKIKETFSVAWEFIKKTASAFVEWFKVMWDKYGDGIMNAASKAWDYIKTVFEIALDNIKALFAVFKALFSGDWEGMWDAIKNFVNTVWENIWKFIGAWLDSILATLGAIIPMFLDAGKALINAIWDGIKAIYKAVVDWFRDLFKDGIVGALASIGSAMFNAGAKLISSAWDGMKSIGSSVADWAKGFFGGLKGDAEDALSAVERSAKFAEDALARAKNASEQAKSFYDTDDIYDPIQGSGGRNKPVYKFDDGSSFQSFAKGSKYIPFDMMAKVHKGEKIIPASEVRQQNQEMGINIETMIVREESDIKKIAREIFLMQKMEGRGMGYA